MRAAPTRSRGRCARRAGMRHGERRALAERLSTATVPPCSRDQLLDQRQADARAFVGARARALDAVEALEDARQLLARNADAGVARPQSSTSRRATPATRGLSPRT